MIRVEGISMQYDFDNAAPRRNTYCYKWDVAPGELPMWVADMEFKVAPEIVADLAERLKIEAYGYSMVPEEWYDAYIGWWGNRHGLEVKRDELVFATGVIPIISSAVRRLTNPNEKVVIQTPVYNVFFNCAINNGCQVADNPLVFDGSAWQIDFEDLDKKLADPQTTLMILCNPQNPCGRIWTASELAHIGELCSKHGVTVISDEIHCDVASPGLSYVPFASVSEICRDISITCWSPSKAFNLAGLHSACAFVPNKHLRDRIVRGLNNDECAEPNFLAVTAAVSAFTKGGEWLDQMNRYVDANKAEVIRSLEGNSLGLKVLPSQATYLLWINAQTLAERAKASGAANVAGYIRKTTGLFMSNGEQYGGGAHCIGSSTEALPGYGFVRLNVASPRSMVDDAINRIKSLSLE